MSQTNSNEVAYKMVVMKCPKCQSSKTVQIPTKIINQSKQLTTVSIPGQLVCEHTFQAFVDKNFKVRGYQNVDFELARMEFLEEEEEEKLNIPSFNEIVGLLRQSFSETEVLGTAILSEDGNVLYSSLPQDAISSTMKEFEVRNEKKLVPVKKMFLEFDNNEKICSEFIVYNDIKFAIVVMFSSDVRLGLGNLMLRELTSKIEALL